MKRFHVYCSKCRYYYAFEILISILLTVAMIFTSTILGRLTEQLSGLTGSELGRGAILVVVAFLLQELLDTGYQLLSNRIDCYTYSDIQRRILRKILRLPSDHPCLKKSSDLYTLMNRDGEEYTEFLSKTVPTIIFQTVRLLLTLIFITMVDRRISFIYMAATVFSLLLQFFISRSMEKASYELKKSQSELNGKLKDVLENRMVIKVWGCFDWIRDHWRQQESTCIKVNILMSVQTMPLSLAGIVCGIFPVLILCLVGLYLIPMGLISVSAFMTVFYLCQNILPDQLHYADLWRDAARVKPSKRRLFDFFEETEKDVPVKTISLKAGEKQQNGTILLEHVWYRYPESENWVLEDVSLRIEEGKKVAIAGPSGCGKSTLLKLVGGLIVPQKGTIRAFQAVYEAQSPFLFTDTIKQNILYSCDKNDAFFKQACEVGYLNEFVLELEKGYETEIQEDGAEFSGGQRQRIALSRTLNSRKKILLLDEVFSALDPLLAGQIMVNLVEQYPDTTMVFGLHQKELMPLMDEVYLFGQGKLVDHGSYEELCRRNISFSEAFR